MPRLCVQKVNPFHTFGPWATQIPGRGCKGVFKKTTPLTLLDFGPRKSMEGVQKCKKSVLPLIVPVISLELCPRVLGTQI